MSAPPVRSFAFLAAGMLCLPAMAQDRKWTYSGSLEIESVAERRFDLESSDGDAVTFEPGLEFGVAFEPDNGPRFYAAARLRHGMFLQEADGGSETETKAELRQAYFEFDGPRPGLTIQFGRQRFEDERGWWYDEDLDALRLLYETGSAAFELSASRNAEVGGDVLGRERVGRGDNLMAVANYAHGTDSVTGLYLIAQDRGAEPAEKPLFLGLQSFGSVYGVLDYRVDAAIVRGRDAGNDIRAYGFDAGVEYAIDVEPQPTLILGLAFGSGDSDALDSTDGNFRQTGLQSSYFDYGEVLAPELSNLWIHTIGIAVDVRSDTSIRALYHRYRQDQAADMLRDTLIERSPNGLDRDLGAALDLTVSREFGESIYLDLIVGAFDPGRAFGPDARRAYFTQLAFTWEFQ